MLKQIWHLFEAKLCSYYNAVCKCKIWYAPILPTCPHTGKDSLHLNFQKCLCDCLQQLKGPCTNDTFVTIEISPSWWQGKPLNTRNYSDHMPVCALSHATLTGQMSHRPLTQNVCILSQPASLCKLEVRELQDVAPLQLPLSREAQLPPPASSSHFSRSFLPAFHNFSV